MASRWGLTLPLPMLPLSEHEDLVRRAEAAGYTDLWSGETNGPDGFTPLALGAAWTDRVRLGTGVVGVFTRGPALLAQQAAALAGERADGGFKLERAPAERVPIIVAALRGKMLRLAVEKGDGAFTNFLPLAGLPKVTEALEGAPEGFELLCRFFCLPGPREEVEPLARFMFASYATVPFYEAFFRWLGYGAAIDDMVEAWKRKDRDAATAAAPWDLIEDTFVFGEPDEMRERLRRFVDGGITLPILTPVTTPDRLGEMIEALAP